MTVPLIRLIFGALLVFFGHRLFWLLAAIAGFLFGIQLAGSLGFNWPHWMQILLALALGLGMALLAVLSIRIAGMVVGFLIGWVLVVEIMSALGVQAGTLNLILAALGGVIGAILTLAVFDYAVIILSALAGASTVVSALVALTGVGPGNPLLLIVGVVLAIVGIVFQWRDLEDREVPA
jgi:hypothetical protein